MRCALLICICKPWTFTFLFLVTIKNEDFVSLHLFHVFFIFEWEVFKLQKKWFLLNRSNVIKNMHLTTRKDRQVSMNQGKNRISIRESRIQTSCVISTGIVSLTNNRGNCGVFTVLGDTLSRIARIWVSPWMVFSFLFMGRTDSGFWKSR